MNSLEKFENTVTIALICVGWLHVPVLVLAGWATRQDIVFALCTGVALAALPTLLLSLKRPRFAIALAIAIAFVGHTSLFAYLLKGHPWQIEAHFYYFALLAMLSGFCDWRVIVAAAGLIAVHHIGLNFLFPAALYPGGSDLGRVAFHAGIVVLEAVMLSGITIMMRNAFAAAYGATGEAERAAIELRDLAVNRETELAITMKRRDELNALIGRFEQELAESLEALHQTAQMLENNASGLGATAESASSQSMKVAAITEETSIQVKTVAQAGDALAQTIAEVGASVSASSRLAGEAVSEAKATTSAIDEMAKVADEIGNVTNLISAIAGQTNLLALNATIEAARAGDAGRGFAVVAQEVKALAAQTAAATQDIATRIEAMQQATGKSVSAIGQISAVITELDRFSARMSSTVEEQVASARDIAGSVSSVAEGVGEVAASVGQIEQVAERASRAASELNSSAAAVTTQTQRIRERVQFFASELARLRAMRASTPSAGSRAATA